MNKSTCFAAAAALLFVTHVASATVLVAGDDFQQYAPTTLLTTAGGTGWAGNWQTALTGNNKPQVADVNGKRSLQLSATSSGAAYRVMNTTLSGDVFVDFMFQYNGLNGATPERNDFLALWLDNSVGPNIGMKGNCDTATCTNDAFVRIGGTSGSTSRDLFGSAMESGVNYHLFGHLYKTGVSGNYTNFDAWINPTALEMSTLSGPDASFFGNSQIASFNKIGFRTENLNTGVNVRIDDLKISVVPEPGTFALFGLALMGMAGMRRVKRG